MSQAGNTLSGSWTAIWSFCSTEGGTLSGQVAGDQVSIRFTHSNASLCPYQATLTRSGSTIGGNYAGVNCVGSVTGIMTISKSN